MSSSGDELSPEDQRDRLLARLHIVDGLIEAFNRRHEIIDEIGSVADRVAARAVLQSADWNFSEVQVAHILDVPFGRVTELGRQHLVEEREHLLTALDELR